MASEYKNQQPRAAVKSATQKAVPHPPLPVDGNGYFSNYQLAAAVLFTPWLLITLTPWMPFRFWSYLLYLLVSGVPVTVAYWMMTSAYGPRINEHVKLPNRPQSDYLVFNDAKLKEQYSNRKIPMQVFHDAYFDGKVDVKGDMLDVLEYRHDWANFNFTWELLRFVLFSMLPDVLIHSRSQDEEQVRDHYDRGDDFYEWFLGPRMIYTSGVSVDPNKEETLEELQDNKLALMCHKIDLQEKDTLLDIGCGWGTACAYAGKNYGCDVTGVTLSRNQTAFGNARLRKNGVAEDKGRILCLDYRDIPQGKKFSKIITLEMGEHVGVLRYHLFCKQIYNLLEDEGTVFLQISGFRPSWQFEDLVWGLFSVPDKRTDECPLAIDHILAELRIEQKYVFPGADACAALNWHLSKWESAGFEVKSVDVLGVHYSATLWRWYRNWLANESKVKDKYGNKLYRTWLYFLAASTITARQGGASLFQIVFQKNINYVQRIEGVPSHSSLHITPTRKLSPVE